MAKRRLLHEAVYMSLNMRYAIRGRRPARS